MHPMALLPAPRLLSLVAIFSGVVVASLGLFGYLGGRNSHPTFRGMLLLGIGLTTIGFGIITRPSPAWLHHVVIMSGIFVMLSGDVVLLTASRRRGFARTRAIQRARQPV
jgi:hypothetical protein